MTRIEGGTFLFHGKPTQLATFCMDQTEVTVGAYMACVRARACLPPSLENISSSSSYCNFRRAPDLPMTCINPAEAAIYCRAQGKRLPSEAQWTYAAFGFDGRLYPWGNGADGDEVCIGRSLSDGPCPVGSHPKGRSAFGLDDMGANVGEIVESGTAFRAMGGNYWHSLSSVTNYQAADRGSPTWGVRCMAP